MALLTACPDLPEVWLSPTLHHPDDLWNKFDLESDRTLVLPNPSPNSCDQSFAAFLDMGGGGGGGGGGYMGLSPTGALPTPPHSPPTEHDLDDLVASIPEILESPSASPPSAISEILSDLEGMETSGTPSPPRMDGAWGAEWWGAGMITPLLEAPIKRDIMWGGGGTTASTASTNTTVTTTATSPPSGNLTPMVEIKKERQDSESSEAAYRDVMTADDLSDDSDTDDNLPDTPSCTDSDCDADDPSWPPPHTSSHHTTTTAKGHHLHHHQLASPSVSSEHNYCGRVPELHHHHTTGTITPSDTEDEVDVVSCSEPNDTTNLTTTTTTATARLHLPPPTPTTTTTPTTSKDVKRQLQLAIQEAVRNRQNRTNNSLNTTSSRSSSGGVGGDSTTTTTTTAEGDVNGTGSAARLVSVKIKTQGKPAAYTKRMRDYHSEVVKSTKHRRRNKGENDEGRRSVHNSLERQRRVDLRNAFEYLRQLVPDTMILEKAPKVQILKKAALHCKTLQQAEQRLIREKEKLRKQVEELKQRQALSS